MKQQKFSFKTLNVIWLALITGQIVFLGVVFFMDVAKNSDLKGLMEYVAAIVAISTIGMSGIVYQKLVNQANTPSKSVDDKLSQYQTAFIVKMGLIEGGNLICIVAYMLTQVLWLLPLIVGSFVWQFLQAPSRKQFIEDFKISRSDVDAVPQG